MEPQTEPKIDLAFKEDVHKGLTSYPKFLYSKYIYDERGDRLFQQIMDLPEYYLTNCEFDILSMHSEEIISHFRNGNEGFDLIELGAGDGKKTKILLRSLIDNEINFTYKPIDISLNSIENLSQTLENEFPKLDVKGERGEYFEVLERISNFRKRKKVIMVLGSNIGNLLHKRAIKFLTKLKDTMNEDDLLFIGFDQKKDPQIILNAYNDDTGITAAFNKNLLLRINKELDANFDLDKFKHWEVYNPETGTAKSYLVSKEAHKVEIEALEITVEFDKWETIHTEISQKYDDKVVSWLVNKSELTILNSFSDPKKFYKNYLLGRKNL